MSTDARAREAAIRLFDVLVEWDDDGAIEKKVMAAHLAAFAAAERGCDEDPRICPVCRHVTVHVGCVEVVAETLRIVQERAAELDTGTVGVVRMDQMQAASSC